MSARPASANAASGARIANDTAFRIASMTKSFTALAVLKLRDEGKLSLEDPVSRWIPEFAGMALPTRDTPPLRVRQLLSHSAGFPEDNPWGDQQLSATDAALDAWLRAGIPFSTPPGTRYEYSNYAFGLLGRIVHQGVGRRLRAVSARRDPDAARDDAFHAGVRGGAGGAPRDWLSTETGRQLRGGAAAAARRVRRDGRTADDRAPTWAVTSPSTCPRGRRATRRRPARCAARRCARWRTCGRPRT